MKALVPPAVLCLSSCAVTPLPEATRSEQPPTFANVQDSIDALNDSDGASGDGWFRVLDPTAHAAPQSTVSDPDAAPSQGHETSTEEFFLPFFGEAARERGYDLPRPVGMGVNVMFINRPTEITSVQAGINGGGLNEIEFLGFDAEASVRTIISRLDAWVLPMVNVYLLGGYIWNTSQVRMTVDLPGASGTPVNFEGDLEGPTYGGGITVAGGYKEFFATADANYTKSELGGLNDFEAALYTIRIGWNTKFGDDPLRLYTGATYWDTKRTISGSITTPGPGIQSVEFAVDQEPVDPITVILGTTLTVNDHLWIMLEFGGWEGTQSMIGGITWRL
ncbi:MAG: hypothetical protein AAF726_03140 [Planctomycetota bacterium]